MNIRNSSDSDKTSQHFEGRPQLTAESVPVHWLGLWTIRSAPAYPDGLGSCALWTGRPPELWNGAPYVQPVSDFASIQETLWRVRNKRLDPTEAASEEDPLRKKYTVRSHKVSSQIMMNYEEAVRRGDLSPLKADGSFYRNNGGLLRSLEYRLNPGRAAGLTLSELDLLRNGGEKDGRLWPALEPKSDDEPMSSEYLEFWNGVIDLDVDGLFSWINGRPAAEQLARALPRLRLPGLIACAQSSSGCGLIPLYFVGRDAVRTQGEFKRLYRSLYEDLSRVCHSLGVDLPAMDEGFGGLHRLWGTPRRLTPFPFYGSPDRFRPAPELDALPAPKPKKAPPAGVKIRKKTPVSEDVRQLEDKLMTAISQFPRGGGSLVWDDEACRVTAWRPAEELPDRLTAPLDHDPLAWISGSWSPGQYHGGEITPEAPPYEVIRERRLKEEEERRRLAEERRRAAADRFGAELQSRRETAFMNAVIFGGKNNGGELKIIEELPEGQRDPETNKAVFRIGKAARSADFSDECPPDLMILLIDAVTKNGLLGSDNKWKNEAAAEKWLQRSYANGWKVGEPGLKERPFEVTSSIKINRLSEREPICGGWPVDVDLAEAKNGRPVEGGAVWPAREKLSNLPAELCVLSGRETLVYVKGFVFSHWPEKARSELLSYPLSIIFTEDGEPYGYGLIARGPVSDDKAAHIKTFPFFTCPGTRFIVDRTSYSAKWAHGWQSAMNADKVWTQDDLSRLSRLVSQSEAVTGPTVETGPTAVTPAPTAETGPVTSSLLSGDETAEQRKVTGQVTSVGASEVIRSVEKNAVTLPSPAAVDLAAEVIFDEMKHRVFYADGQWYVRSGVIYKPIDLKLFQAQIISELKALNVRIKPKKDEDASQPFPLTASKIRDIELNLLQLARDSGRAADEIRFDSVLYAGKVNDELYLTADGHSVRFDRQKLTAEVTTQIDDLVSASVQLETPPALKENGELVSFSDLPDGHVIRRMMEGFSGGNNKRLHRILAQCGKLMIRRPGFDSDTSHALINWYGESGVGKTLLSEVIDAARGGPLASTSKPRQSDLDPKNRFGAAEFFKSAVSVCDDLDITKKHTPLILNLVTLDHQIERKNKDPVRVTSLPTVLIMSNFEPALGNNVGAMARRLDVVNFGGVPLSADRQAEMKALKKDKDGLSLLISVCVREYLRQLKDGRVETDDDGALETQAAEMDRELTWIRRFTEKSDTALTQHQLESIYRRAERIPPDAKITPSIRRAVKAVYGPAAVTRDEGGHYHYFVTFSWNYKRSINELTSRRQNIEEQDLTLTDVDAEKFCPTQPKETAEVTGQTGPTAQVTASEVTTEVTGQTTPPAQTEVTAEPKFSLRRGLTEYKASLETSSLLSGDEVTAAEQKEVTGQTGPTAAETAAETDRELRTLSELACHGEFRQFNEGWIRLFKKAADRLSFSADRLTEKASTPQTMKADLSRLKGCLDRSRLSLDAKAELEHLIFSAVETCCKLAS